MCYYVSMVSTVEAPPLTGETYRAASRQVTAAAIRVGLLRPRPCEVCGRRRSIHAHHVDYARPLEVRWLCRWCHLEQHHPGSAPAPAPLAPAPAPAPAPPARAAYVVDGETWADLLLDLQRQIFERANVEGLTNAARRLRISTTTLWRFGRRCQKVANPGKD